MLKKIGIGVAVVVVAIAGIAWYLFSNLDSYVKTAIETYGSEATKSAVRVDSVKISLSTGEASISGLSVANPDGFSSAKAIAVGVISLKLDTGSIRGTGPILVRDISVKEPQVSYELKGGEGNLQTLQKNAQAYAAQFKSSGDARKEIIDVLTIESGQVSATASELQGKTLKLPLPDIHLRDIGKSTGGATPAQIAGQVVTAITHEAQNVAAGALQQQITSAIGGAVGGTDTGGVANQVKGLFGK